MEYEWNKIPVLKLPVQDEDAQIIARAGVLPFYRKGDACEFLFTTPVHKPGYSKPKDQIAKGGRLEMRDGSWEEIEDRNQASLEGMQLEPYLDAAMREGREELGLTSDVVSRLYEIGPVEFLSEKKRAPLSMYLFAAEVKSKEGFEAPMHPVERVRWLNLEQFKLVGRGDHRVIVESVMTKLGISLPSARV